MSDNYTGQTSFADMFEYYCNRNVANEREYSEREMLRWVNHQLQQAQAELSRSKENLCAAEAELSAYKSGVEVEGKVYCGDVFTWVETCYIHDSELLNGQRVKVLITKE